jgi:hypothetical protein
MISQPWRDVGLETMVNTCLLQNSICCVARFAASIDRYIQVGDGAEPDFMITFGMADKAATMLTKQRLERFAKPLHHASGRHAARMSGRSKWVMMVGVVPSFSRCAFS